MTTSTELKFPLTGCGVLQTPGITPELFCPFPSAVFRQGDPQEREVIWESALIPLGTRSTYNCSSSGQGISLTMQCP